MECRHNASRSRSRNGRLNTRLHHGKMPECHPSNPDNPPERHQRPASNTDSAQHVVVCTLLRANSLVSATRARHILHHHGSLVTRPAHLLCELHLVPWNPHCRKLHRSLTILPRQGLWQMGRNDEPSACCWLMLRCRGRNDEPSACCWFRWWCFCCRLCWCWYPVNKWYRWWCLWCVCCWWCSWYW